MESIPQNDDHDNTESLIGNVEQAHADAWGKLRSDTPINEVRVTYSALDGFTKTIPSSVATGSVEEFLAYCTNGGKPVVIDDKKDASYFCGELVEGPLIGKTKAAMIKRKPEDPNPVGVQRSARHCTGSSVVKLDLDGVDEVALQRIASKVRELRPVGAMYTTHSHGSEKAEGKTRARLILILDRAASSAEFKTVSKVLAKVLLGESLDESEGHAYQQAGVFAAHPDRVDVAWCQTINGKQARPISVDGALALAGEILGESGLSWGMGDLPEHLRRFGPATDDLGAGTGYAPPSETEENIQAARHLLKSVPHQKDRMDWISVIWGVLDLGWACAEDLAREWAAENCDGYEDSWGAGFDNAVVSFDPTRQGKAGFGSVVTKARENGWDACLPWWRKEDGVTKAARRLADMAPASYERLRKSEAKALDIRVSVLDEAVEVERGKLAGGDAQAHSDDMAWVQEFNARYSPVLYGGKMRVGFFEHDRSLDRETMTFVSFKTFTEMHMADYGVIGHDKKGPKVGPKGVWLKVEGRTPNRTAYFDPAMPPKLEREGYLNLWSGFAVRGDSEGGDPELMLRHIREVICDNDPERIDYVMGWTALLIQQPGLQHGVALVLRGQKGVGKGVYGNLLCKIFGRHALHLAKSKALTGNFNAHLQDACFVFADEAFFAGDRSSDGALKSLITEPTMSVEPKGVDLFTVRNWMSVLMATNSEWVAPMGADERRYAVMDVTDARRTDRPYFDALVAWAADERNICAFVEWMRAYDLSDFKVRNVPETEGLKEQRALSLPTWAKWWGAALGRGRFAGDRWDGFVGFEYLVRSYSLYLDSTRVNSYERMTENALAKAIIPVAGKTMKAPIGERVATRTNSYDWHAEGSITRVESKASKGGGKDERPSCKHLKTLADARARFIQHFKLPETYFDTEDDAN